MDIFLQDSTRVPVTVGAGVTNQQLMEFGASHDASRNLRASAVCSGVTVGAGISFKLQHRAKGGAYADLASANATAAITANGTVSIVLNVQRAADQADLPLHKQCRLVVTTGAGSAVTFDQITVQL